MKRRARLAAHLALLVPGAVLLYLGAALCVAAAWVDDP